MLLLVPCPPQDASPEEARYAGLGGLFEDSGSMDTGGWHFFGIWHLEAMRGLSWHEFPEGRGQWAVGS